MPTPRSSDRPDPERERIVDELLVLRAHQGESEAFEQLVGRWHERLWRHAQRLTGRADLASDALQESWVGIARGLGRLEAPGAFRRWAYTIVTRAAADQLRRGGREVPHPPEHFDRAVEPDDEQGERAEAVRLLRRALGRLSPDERSLVSLRYLEGFELWELSQILELPEGTLKSRLHRIRKRLRDLLTRSES